MKQQGRLSPDPIDLIVVEDSAVDLELEIDALREAGFAVEVRQVEGEAAFHAALDQALPAGIIADWTLPGFSGQRAFDIARERCPEVPFIFVSGTLSETAALDAVRKGANDYVFKHQLQRLGPALSRALDEAKNLRALRESEESYRTLIENASDAILLAGADGRFLKVNRRACEMFGYAEDEFIGLPASAIGTPDELARQQEAFRRIAAGERVLSEGWARRKDGSVFASELSASPAAGGEVLAIVRDITERKQAAVELEKKNALLNALINSPTDIVIFSLDRNYCYTVFNEKHREEMRAIWQTEIQVGSNLLEAMSDSGLRQLARQSIDRALGGESFTEIRHQDGADIHYEFSWNPVLRPDGKVAGVTAFVRDITEQIASQAAKRESRRVLLSLIEDQARDQAALATSEARSRAITESAYDAIITSDGAGNIVGWNGGAQRMFGYTQGQAVGQPMALLMPQRYRDAHRTEMDRVSADEAIRQSDKRIELQGLRQDGSEFPLEFTLARWENDNGWLFTAIMSDITERKAAEEMQEMQARRAAVLLALPLMAGQMNEHDFMQYAQEQAEQLTGSSIAFTHLVHEDQQNIELVAWSRGTLEHYCTAVADKHYPVSQAGLWADALRQRKAVVINDYASAPQKHGLPEGHANLERLISVPVMESKLVRMMAGVGNKSAPYTDQDVETVQLISDTVWRIVHQARIDADLRRLNQTYAALSHSNEAIVKIDSADALFAEVCRITVALGGMKMAWIGLVDGLGAGLKPVARFGDTLEHLKDVHIALAVDMRSGNGPTAVAIRENRPVWCQDFLNDPSTASWHELGATSGFGAWAALPLHCGGAITGVFNLYSGEQNAFDEQTRNLLVEMAANISHALDGFARERARRQSEANLEASEARLKAMFHASPMGIALIDSLSGHVYSVNTRFAQIAGRELAEMQRIDWMNITHPDDIQLDLDNMAAMNAGETHGFQMQKRYLRPDGSVVWVNMTVAQVDMATGSSPRHLCMIEDISSRKADEDLIRKLSQAVEQSPESIVITDVNVHIEYVNQAFLDSTGYSREELLGKNPRVLNSGKTPPETYAAMWDALSNGQPWKGNLHNRRKDGSEYDEFAIITPLRGPDGKVTHYVGVKDDVTEKKRTAEELDRYRSHLEELVATRTAELNVARQRAESANVAKSAFVANMSHEIRTPMNAIIGLSHLLRRSGATPEQTVRLDKIDNAGRHLLSIINDILDLSKIEAERLQLESTDFHLGAVLDAVASMIGEAARDKGLRIEVDADTVPVWLHGDPMRLRQALLNYAGNAVKFTAKGSIALRARLIEDSGGELLVRFEVEDSGIGIAAGTIDRLFQAFEQGDASTARQFGGSGLGLAISGRLARLMGGNVGADSTLGKGSTFWFTARLQRGHGPTTAAAPITDVSGAEAKVRLRHAGARLLVAEDNAINREVALELLQRVGLRVDMANDGLEAVAMAQAGDYDLILMDIQMPHMDGLEAARTLRALPGWVTKPILALTADAFEEDRRASKAAGMDDFIVKPVEPDLLYAVLLKWLPVKEDAAETGSDTATQGAQTPGIATTGKLPALTDNTAAQTGMARLAGLPGLNAARGVAALRGNTVKYLGLLGDFVEGHKDDMAQLDASLAAGDYATARRLAHTLKGTAATLGAERIAETAGRLQQMLPASAQQKIHPDAIRPEMTAITLELTALATALPPPTLPLKDAAPLDKQALRALLNQLDALLAQSDTSAVALFEAHAEALRAALGAPGEQLGRAIGRFEFEVARQILQEQRQASGSIRVVGSP